MKGLTFCSILLFGQPMLVASTGDAQSTQSYSVRGMVEKIAPDLSQVTIHHQAIPGYMMEMTMDFNVKHTNELGGISPKDEITFRLVVDKDDEWIENIHRIGRSSEPINEISTKKKTSGDAMASELKAGDTLPDYVLTTEQGRQIHISDFRGKALAFTFFFTRCPLPDYCPRMNRNLEQARTLLLADSNAPPNWQLLSISFDPGFDSPQVLASYAGVYRGTDTNRWLFALAQTNVLADVAARLDLMVMRQGGSISHNLRTVVLDPAGRIYRQFDGNEWTASQLADAIVRAARPPAP